MATKNGRLMLSRRAKGRKVLSNLIERSPLPLRGSVSPRRLFECSSRQHSKDVLVLVKNFCNQHRVGLITSKKKLRRAVDRNRFRRIARASLRTLDTNTGFDVIFMAKAHSRFTSSDLFSSARATALKAVSKSTPKRNDRPGPVDFSAIGSWYQLVISPL